jgi:hypothetical protein
MMMAAVRVVMIMSSASATSTAGDAPVELVLDGLGPGAQEARLFVGMSRLGLVGSRPNFSMEGVEGPRLAPSRRHP